MVANCDALAIALYTVSFLNRKKCGKTPEFMVFSDVPAVLFEELFCLKEKDVARDLYCSKSAK